MFTRFVGYCILLVMVGASHWMRGATISDLDDPLGRVSRLEYFFDQDPGVGEGVPIDFTPDEQGGIQLNLDLSLNGLSHGMHQLFIRAQNGRNEWSIPSKHAFFHTPFATRAVPVLEKGEYFLGEDPGLGNGTSAIPNRPSEGGVAFSIQSPSVSPGHHMLQFRAQDSFGNWSMPLKHSFLQTPDIRVTGVEWSLIEGEEIVAEGTQAIEPPASRFSAMLTTPLVNDASIPQRSLQAQAHLVLEERIPSVSQSFDLEILSVVEPLRIITPPSHQTLTAGDSLNLSVTVAGGGEVAFQWFHNGQPIAGANGASLEIGAVGLEDAGSYYVQIESPVGNLQSQTAILTVNDPDSPVGGTAHHPADANQDLRIIIGEVTAYGAAWKRGDTWPTGPNPIPIGYLTRAGALWKGGEVYEQDASLSQAPLWWVNPSGSTRARSIYVPSVSRNIAVREMDASSVQIHVQPALATQVYAVEEAIPEGYGVIHISHGGVFDERTHQVRWGPFMDQQPRVLSYQRVAGGEDFKTISIRGMASFDGFNVMVRESNDAATDQDGPSLSIRIGEGGKAQISVDGVLEDDFVVESSDSLQDAVWSEIGTVRSGVRGWTGETDALHLQRFYRIRKNAAAAR